MSQAEPRVPAKGAHRLTQPEPGRDTGAILLIAAAILLLLLAAAQGYVSFRAQYTFIDHAKRTRLPSILEAIGLDTGAVIFALLALSLARRGQRGTIERILNVTCAVGSMVMNLLAAELGSPRSVAVWVMPSVLYAFASDRLIAVVRRWVRSSDPGVQPGQENSPWRSAGGGALWLIRLLLDPLGTLRGIRRWVLLAVPTAPRELLPSAGPATEPPGETKREALIRLYEERGTASDPRYGNPAKTAQLASELAGQIGYHPGTARRELAKYVAIKFPRRAELQLEAGPGLRPVQTDTEEVA